MCVYVGGGEGSLGWVWGGAGWVLGISAPG